MPLPAASVISLSVHSGISHSDSVTHPLSAVDDLSLHCKMQRVYNSISHTSNCYYSICIAEREKLLENSKSAHQAERFELRLSGG